MGEVVMIPPPPDTHHYDAHGTANPHLPVGVLNGIKADTLHQALLVGGAAVDHLGGVDAVEDAAEICRVHGDVCWR